jgi:glucose dehydrogenase
VVPKLKPIQRGRPLPHTIINQVMSMAALHSALIDGPGRPRQSLLLTVAAIIVGLFGLASVIGGTWLIGLSGSWYYAVAGLAMLATAALLWRRNAAALHLFALVVLGTVIWAVAEIGFDWWQLVPRGDLIFLVGLFLATPWVAHRSSGGRWLRAAAPLIGSLAIAAVVGIISTLALSTSHPPRRTTLKEDAVIPIQREPCKPQCRRQL